MAQQNSQLHFVLIPFMAQGHMIPMIDIARLLSQRGVSVTLVLTPLNNLRFKSVTDRAIQSGLSIRVLEVKLPSVEAGLPPGCENLDDIPSRDLANNFFLAISMLQKPLEESLGEMELMPSCVISDFYLPWTSKIALKFKIPRLVFHGVSCFSLLCFHNILHHKVHLTVTSETKIFAIPDLPDHIEITKALLPGGFNKNSSDTRSLHDESNDAQAEAYGIVINSFNALETMYVKQFQEVKQGKAWCVGPVSLCNKEHLDKTERGNKASIDETQCLKWLDSRAESSVIYVSLGSLCRLVPAQLMEIGLGLEASKHPFIWVIRGGERYRDLDKWLTEEGFLDRTKKRGLVIRGWAPQVLILSHHAVGGFLTHCGWNSILEGVSAGVPMITWPLFSDQFLNEKLIVQVLKIGIRVGVNESVPWGQEEKVGVLVSKEQVEKAVTKLFYKGIEAEERRKIVRELADLAKKAMEEGGSSHLSITLMIKDIEHYANGKVSRQTEQ